jgi:antitoxin ParD1/3/4
VNVSLTPELERLVQKKVATGRYGSASEVVREALRLLEEREVARAVELRALQQQVAVGILDLDHRRRRRFDAVATRRIKATGRKRLERSRNRSG